MSNFDVNSDSSEIERRIARAIDRLPEQDHEMIVMRHVQRLSIQTIATALGMSEHAATLRHLRAIRRLHESLTFDTSHS